VALTMVGLNLPAAFAMRPLSLANGFDNTRIDKLSTAIAEPITCRLSAPTLSYGRAQLTAIAFIRVFHTRNRKPSRNTAIGARLDGVSR